MSARCRAGLPFRLAAFTPPPELYAAGELRATPEQGGVAAESRPARLKGPPGIAGGSSYAPVRLCYRQRPNRRIWVWHLHFCYLPPVNGLRSFPLSTVIRTYLRLYNRHLFPFAQLPQDFSLFLCVFRRRTLCADTSAQIRCGICNSTSYEINCLCHSGSF